MDTACSSSLVAMDMAALHLYDGSCCATLVGGVNLILSPHLFTCFSKARMLSMDCRCKTFDERANGYARGEGAAAVLLKPLEEARKENANVIAVVRGTAVNHDGRTASLTAPNGPAQQDVLRTALQKGGIRPQSIRFVEAHGTGRVGLLSRKESSLPSEQLYFCDPLRRGRRDTEGNDGSLN